jgi:hypothetical protein
VNVKPIELCENTGNHPIFADVYNFNERHHNWYSIVGYWYPARREAEIYIWHDTHGLGIHHLPATGAADAARNIIAKFGACTARQVDNFMHAFMVAQ